MASNLVEVTLGFERGGRGPSQNHHAALPALCLARGIAHAAEQILDQIGRRQYALKGFGQFQPHHGKGFFQPLAQGARRYRMRGLQAVREIVEQETPGALRIARRVGLVHRAAH